MASTMRGSVLRRIDTLFRQGTAAGLPDTHLVERFLTQGDTEAFEALVLRHGPMVLNTCRAVLNDIHDAEDAFQATFLVLVKKAGSVRGRDALGGWLHRVAYRIAIVANADTARRRLHEHVAAEARPEAQGLGTPLESRSAAVHEELDRLPEKYRLPIVHCYLEGKTHAQAAAELRWGEATVRRRLAAARELLRSRLTSRGLAPALAALTASTVHEASAAIPEPWLRSTVNAAFAMVASRGAATGVAAALAEAALKGMATARFTFAGVATLALGVAATMGTGLVAALAGDEPRPIKAQPAPERPKGTRKKEAPASEAAASPYTGRVLDPSGKPVAGATLFSTFLWSTRSERAPLTSTSNPDGRFRIALPECPEEEFPGKTQPSYVVVAKAPGYGLAIEKVGPSERPDVLRLVEDEAITVRVLDLEGRPVVGATIRPEWLWCPERADLTAYLQAYAHPELPQSSDLPGLSGRVAGMIPPAVTGVDGRVRIEGLGRERLLRAVVEGPRIETTKLTIMTRRAETVRPGTTNPGHISFEPTSSPPTASAATPSMGYSNTVTQIKITGVLRGTRDDGQPTTSMMSREPGVGKTVRHFQEREILGAASDVVLAPSLPISGTVRDRSTGRPLAGVEVRTGYPPLTPTVKATTDREGHYRLTGLPIGREVQLSAAVADDRPYIQGMRPVNLRPGEPMKDVSFDLQRGLWISGRVVDRTTGQPTEGQVTYFAFEDNPHARKEDFPEHQKRTATTSRDGSFRIVGLPGPGIVAFQASHWDYYGGLGADAIRGARKHDAFMTFPPCHSSLYHSLVEVNPPEGAESQAQDLVVDPGRTVTVNFVDPDEKPVSGVVVLQHGLRLGNQLQASKTSEYKVRSLAPGEERTMTFWQDRRHLIARLTVRDDQSGPITLKLQPWGVVTGRLVKTSGELGGVVSVIGMDSADFQGDKVIGSSIGGSSFQVDERGRFRIGGLIPGTKYNLQALGKSGTESFLAKDVSVAPGETRDLGDLTSKAFPR